MRNMGYSIIDIYKPIALTIIIYGTLVLILLNPLISISENKFNEITAKKNSDIYSIKFIDNGMWIKNISNKNEKSFINIKNINLNNMEIRDIKILNISKKSNEIIIAKNGKVKDKIFDLKDVSKLNIKTNKYINLKNSRFSVNFDKSNIIDAISNYKFIPYYKYIDHIKNLKKFDLYSNEISLYYLSEIFKPLFLMIIGFVVMSFSSKFKRNENFFKVLFVAVLIGFLIFLFKEIIANYTSKIKINYIFSYLIIITLPLLIGLYQVIKIEKN
jgi:lipopolysaccharide export LptBFGC system permease protein LptF